MRARFLLGPAGSGKTHRCLAEIRAALRRAPQGPPLVLIAPKQATFQLERQLLADPALPGYTRLQILSFERLAAFVLEELGARPRRQLGEEGRVMVLRALLARARDDLKLFRASARLPGFARQLSQLLREFQRHHLSIKRLETLAAQLGDDPLGHKLHDLARLLRAYQDWLVAHELQDTDGLLDAATAALRLRRANLAGLTPTAPAPGDEPVFDQLALPLFDSPAAGVGLRLGGLWLDGFAEMTPQELDLLAGLLPDCEEATLAFCIESEPRAELSWLSTWAPVSQTFRNAYKRFAVLPDVRCAVEVLARDAQPGRFSGNPVLTHLELHWTNPRPFEAGTPEQVSAALRVARGNGPEAEVVLAARELRRFTRAGKWRFRDAAVLVRQLDLYHDLIRRVFTRFEIPFFLDRREPIAHHPLAELTRSALRLLAYDWRHEDWFSVLKTGLVFPDEDQVDWLENQALARGWEGAFWQAPIVLPDNEADVARRVEEIRGRVMPPFMALLDTLSGRGNRAPVSGTVLADALRQLFAVFQVEETLTAWGEEEGAAQSESRTLHSPFHLTVLNELLGWIENLEVGFTHDALTLKEWLPIVEAGLSGLTAGVIPPALDQVLVGSIDRARNPDLQLTLLLGVNETVFPAPPSVPTLLTEADREALANRNVLLGPGWRQQVGQERFYGYIACTRPRQRLVLTFAERDAAGEPLNPSPFITHLQRLFPGLPVEPADLEYPWTTAEHISELGSAVAGWSRAGGGPEGLFSLPGVATLIGRFRGRDVAACDEAVTPSLALALYGPTLRTSVSRVEQFAACPFRFFVNSGLRAEERKQFAVDARERGNFQHLVLEKFHAELEAARLRWRDVTPLAARERIGRIAAEVTRDYGSGLFRATDENAFAARSLTTALQDLVEAIIRWMTFYTPDPRAVELAFGEEGAGLPAWKLALGEGRSLSFRGKIDRVDLRPVSATEPNGPAWCVVMDYKSSGRKIDPVLLAHGIQLQLPAYLAVLASLPAARERFQVASLVPGGVFYVNLRGEHGSGGSRREVLAGVESDKLAAYKHTGRFSLEVLPLLDQAAGGEGSGQFSYKLTKTGKPNKNYPELMEVDEFGALLAGVEARLREMGQRIFAGEAAVDPYRKGSVSACDYCDYAAVCRIDPWTHEYRVLKKALSPAREDVQP